MAYYLLCPLPAYLVASKYSQIVFFKCTSSHIFFCHGSFLREKASRGRKRHPPSTLELHRLKTSQLIYSIAINASANVNCKNDFKPHHFGFTQHFHQMDGFNCIHSLGRFFFSLYRTLNFKTKVVIPTCSRQAIFPGIFFKAVFFSAPERTRFRFFSMWT